MENPVENYITFFLMAIISAVSLYGIYNKRAFQAMILHPASVVHKKEYYRILSSACVHNSILHLALNLFMLYIFCSGLEESVSWPGRISLLLIIGSSLLAGHLLSLMIYRRDIAYSCAGASGIVLGCMVSYMIVHPFKSHLSFPLIGTIPNIYATAGYLFLTLIYSRKFNRGKIDYGVHIGGAIGGSLSTLLVHPDVITHFL